MDFPVFVRCFLLLNPRLLQRCKVYPWLSVWEKLSCSWIQRDWWIWQTLQYVLKPRRLFIHLNTRGTKKKIKITGLSKRAENIWCQTKEMWAQQSVSRHSVSLRVPIQGGRVSASYATVGGSPSNLWNGVEVIKLLHHSVPRGMWALLPGLPPVSSKLGETGGCPSLCWLPGDGYSRDLKSSWSGSEGDGAVCPSSGTGAPWGRWGALRAGLWAPALLEDWAGL